MSKVRNLKTVNQFANETPAFTAPSIRWLIFQEKHNGLASSGAIVRIGRKVLIDVDKFFDWIDSQNQSAA